MGFFEYARQATDVSSGYVAEQEQSFRWKYIRDECADS